MQTIDPFSHYQNFQESGKREPFDQFYRLTYASVYSFVKYRAKESQLDDVCQAVYLVLYKKSPKFRDEITMWSYIWKTARLISMKSRSVRIESPLIEEGSSYSLPENTMLTQQSVHQCLDKLGSDDQVILQLRFMQERSIEDVANTLKISVSAAQMRISRATERLKKKLEGIGINSAGLACADLLRPESSIEVPAFIAGANATTLATSALSTMALLANLKLALMVAIPVLIGVPAAVHFTKQQQATTEVVAQDLVPDLAQAKKLSDLISGDYTGRVDWKNSDGVPGGSEVQAMVRLTENGASLITLFRYAIDGSTEDLRWTFNRNTGKCHFESFVFDVTWTKNGVTLEGMEYDDFLKKERLTRYNMTRIGDQLVIETDIFSTRKFLNKYSLKVVK